MPGRSGLLSLLSLLSPLHNAAASSLRTAGRLRFRCRRARTRLETFESSAAGVTFLAFSERFQRSATRRTGRLRVFLNPSSPRRSMPECQLWSLPATLTNRRERAVGHHRQGANLAFRANRAQTKVGHRRKWFAFRRMQKQRCGLQIRHPRFESGRGLSSFFGLRQSHRVSSPLHHNYLRLLLPWPFLCRMFQPVSRNLFRIRPFAARSEVDQPRNPEESP